MTALIGGTAAILAALIAAAIARGVALANLRQAWINALREDLADFLSTADAATRIEADVRAVVRSGTILPVGVPEETRKRGQELVDKLELLSARIQLRLNPNEDSHRRLGDMIEAMRGLNGNPSRDDLLKLSRAILKREWEVTKYGGFAPFWLYLEDYVGWA